MRNWMLDGNIEDVSKWYTVSYIQYVHRPAVPETRNVSSCPNSIACTELNHLESLLLFIYFLDPGLVCFSAWLRSNRIWVVSQCGWTLPRPPLCHHLRSSIWNIIMDNGVCDSAAKYSIKPNPVQTYSVMPGNDYHQKVPLSWLSHRLQTLPSDCTMHSPTIVFIVRLTLIIVKFQ